MKKFLEEKHDLLAGIFAAIAIIAIICEVAFADFTKESFVSAIKDISGILIDVLVLFIAASAFIKKKQKNIVSILDKSIEEWGNKNLPLVFKVEGFKQAQNSSYTQGFALLQNPREYITVLKKNLISTHPEWSKYASYSSNLTGKFIDMPSTVSMTNGKFDICVVMSQSHFKNMPDFEKSFSGIIECINDNYKDVLTAYPLGKEFKFKIDFKQEIKTQDDINAFIEILDYVVSLVKVVA